MHVHISTDLIIFIDLQYYQYAYIGTDTNNNISVHPYIRIPIFA